MGLCWATAEQFRPAPVPLLWHPPAAVYAQRLSHVLHSPCFRPMPVARIASGLLYTTRHPQPLPNPLSPTTPHA